MNTNEILENKITTAGHVIDTIIPCIHSDATDKVKTIANEVLEVAIKKITESLAQL